MYSYYRPRYAARKPAVKRAPQMATVLGAEVMWALAAYATRVNGGAYLKETERDAAGVVQRQRNRDIIREEVAAGMPNLTEADYQEGSDARKWHQGRLTFKTLRGETLTEFEASLSAAVQQESFSNQTDALAAAIVASQIASYVKGRAQEEAMSTVDRSPLAALGAKVMVKGTVQRSVYSRNYGIYFVTVRTDCNRMVFFSYREGMQEGEAVALRGTVKAHRPDSTQLNRVKVL